MGRFYFPGMIEVFSEIHAFSIWLVGWILCLLVFFYIFLNGNADTIDHMVKNVNQFNSSKLPI
jgi:hypothetical protein